MTHKNEPRLSGPTIKVLGAIMSSGKSELSGADIAKITRLPSGTLYPILFRLEHAGWLASHWEAGDPKALGRPRRRFYQITTVGARSARATLRDLANALGGLEWA
jgi:DNA-binding PadR family transcriptional regulator